MKGVVLAAGFGKRLLPLTDSIPKPLLPLGCMPLIGYSLKLLASVGIRDIFMNIHYLAEQLPNALGDGSDYGVKITYYKEKVILGTGGGLKNMQKDLGDDDFVVINSDTVLDVDLHAVLRAHKASNAMATMVLRNRPEHDNFGVIGVNEEGYISQILDKKLEGQKIFPLMFTGLQVLSNKFLDYLPQTGESCVVRQGYLAALTKRELLYGYISRDYWVDAGTPKSYWQCNMDALSAKKPLIRYADPLLNNFIESYSHTKILQTTYIARDVKIAASVRLGPNVLLSEHVEVRENCYIANSVVLPGTKIRPDVSLNHCLVTPQTTLNLSSNRDDS